MACSPDFNSGLSTFLINLYFLGVNLIVLRIFFQWSQQSLDSNEINLKRLGSDERKSVHKWHAPCMSWREEAPAT